MSAEVEEVPQEVLEAARLRFKRRCAALICQMMAEDGGTAAEIAARVGWSEAKWWRELRALLEGKTKRIDMVADLATAMYCELVPKAIPLAVSQENPDEAAEPTP